MAHILSACRTACTNGTTPSAAMIEQRICALAAAGLAERECERLRLIRNQSARLQSVAARLALLRALSGEGGVHDFDAPLPADADTQRPLAAFCRNEQGVPRLLGHTAAISLAHCDRLAVAVCNETGGRIGADVEPLDRPMPRAQAMAQRFFSPAELEIWKQNGQQPLDFLRIWTRKEALGKALGTGLHADAPLLDTTVLAPECFFEQTIEGTLVSGCILE